jgi:hypothetical protein
MARSRRACESRGGRVVTPITVLLRHFAARALSAAEVTIPRQSRGLSNLNRSKRLVSCNGWALRAGGFPGRCWRLATSTRRPSRRRSALRLHCSLKPCHSSSSATRRIHSNSPAANAELQEPSNYYCLPGRAGGPLMVASKPRAGALDHGRDTPQSVPLETALAGFRQHQRAASFSVAPAI